MCQKTFIPNLPNKGYDLILETNASNEH